MLRREESHEQIRRYAGCGFSAAVVAAPFIALLYSVKLGLAVMVVALAVTAWLAFAGSRYGDAQQRHRLRILAVINTLVAMAGLAVIHWID